MCDDYITKPLRIYDKNEEELRKFRKDFEKRLDELIETNEKKQYVYRICSRIKEREKVKRKIRKLYYEDKLNNLEDDDVFYRLTDIVGIRIICRFIDELKRIDSVIRKSNFFEIKTTNGNPEIEAFIYKREDVQYIYEGECEVGDDCWFYDKGSHKKLFEIKEKKGYTSVHYLVKPSEEFDTAVNTLTQNGLVVEIQLRSLLQESWAELEHDVSYKQYLDTHVGFQKLSKILHPVDEMFIDFRNQIKVGIKKEEGYKNFIMRIEPRFPGKFWYIPEEMNKIQNEIIDPMNHSGPDWLSAKLDGIDNLPPLYRYLVLIDGDLNLLYKYLKILKEQETFNDDKKGNTILKKILIKKFFMEIERRRSHQFLRLINYYELDYDLYETYDVYLMGWFEYTKNPRDSHVLKKLENHFKEIWQFVLNEKRDSLILPLIVKIILQVWQRVDRNIWTTVIRDSLENHDFEFTKPTILELVQNISQMEGNGEDEQVLFIINIIKEKSSTWDDDYYRDEILNIIENWETKHRNPMGK